MNNHGKTAAEGIGGDLRPESQHEQECDDNRNCKTDSCSKKLEEMRDQVVGAALSLAIQQKIMMGPKILEEEETVENRTNTSARGAGGAADGTDPEE